MKPIVCEQFSHKSTKNSTTVHGRTAKMPRLNTALPSCSHARLRCRSTHQTANIIQIRTQAFLKCPDAFWIWKQIRNGHHGWHKNTKTELLKSEVAFPFFQINSNPMLSHVFIVWDGIPKPTFALLTIERIVAGMDCHVSSEIATIRKTFVAFLTHYTRWFVAHLPADGFRRFTTLVHLEPGQNNKPG